MRDASKHTSVFIDMICAVKHEIEAIKSVHWAVQWCYDIRVWMATDADDAHNFNEPWVSQW